MFTALSALALASGLMLDGAYAARLGGGRGMGIRRVAPMPRRAVPPPATPQQAKPAAPANQPAQCTGNRWLKPLAGLAAGLGLGWLLGQGGLGGFGSVLLMGLLAIAAVAMLARLFANRGGKPLRRMSYADFGGSERAAALPEQAPISASESGSIAGGVAVPLHGPKIPAGFDPGSVREAASAAPEPFDEIWNLEKPVDGHTGWLLAGIEQPQAS